MNELTTEAGNPTRHRYLSTLEFSFRKTTGRAGFVQKCAHGSF